MTDPPQDANQPTSAESGSTTLPVVGTIALGLILVALFVAILFPWDAVARRLTHEIASASGSEIKIGGIRPALSARGPVLTAMDVVVTHPAVDRVRIETLEIAPRLSTSWFDGEPTLRVYADSELAIVDGVLTLGAKPSYDGQMNQIEIERLPLRLDATGIALSGRLDANANVIFDPGGFLTGRVDFTSPELTIESGALPIAIPFTRATGIIELLESGGTQIESLDFEGKVIAGQISGVIKLAHRSQSPPIDLTAQVKIVRPELRGLASAAGITLSTDGEAKLKIGGTLGTPIFRPNGRGKLRERRRPSGRRN